MRLKWDLLVENLSVHWEKSNGVTKSSEVVWLLSLMKHDGLLSNDHASDPKILAPLIIQLYGMPRHGKCVTYTNEPHQRVFKTLYWSFFGRMPKMKHGIKLSEPLPRALKRLAASSNRRLCIWRFRSLECSESTDTRLGAPLNRQL